MGIVDVLAIIGAVCAVCMVLGSFLLLYKGIITLNEAVSKGPALQVEIKKILKVQSQYPALALFIVGVAFLCLSFWFSTHKPTDVSDIQVAGHLDSDAKDFDPSAVNIYCSADFGLTHPDGQGGFDFDCPSNVKLIQIKIATTGYQPGQIIEYVSPHNARNGKVGVSPHKLTKVGDQPVVVPSQIEQPANLPKFGTLLVNPQSGAAQ
jgi:hypothetical protein